MACRSAPSTSEGRFEERPVDSGTSIGEVGTVAENALATVEAYGTATR